MEIEKYTDIHGSTWVRVKFKNKYRTEIIMSEEEFKKKYGKSIEIILKY